MQSRKYVHENDDPVSTITRKTAKRIKKNV